MPLQNRVNPWSEIAATPERYSEPFVVFGNRGCLHGEYRNILRAYNGKMWLACKLHVERTRKRQRDDNRAFNGRKRQLMTPRRYTELFFLDEPTALAAGHRPCACCRRKDFRLFMDAWSTAFPLEGGEKWTASTIDAVLHSERLSEDGGKRVFEAQLESLPEGTMVVLDEMPNHCWLYWQSALHRWSHSGYVERNIDFAYNRAVKVLTPPSIVDTLRAGFQCQSPPISAWPADNAKNDLVAVPNATAAHGAFLNNDQ